jgi:orotidine-5'-phosphate decarboxylase
MHFVDRLAAAVRRCKTAVLVGLDPRFEQLPSVLRGGTSRDDMAAVANCYRTFCCEVVDIVAPWVPAVKPQAAFFEEIGPFGMAALADVIAHARQQGLLVILDAKRNDIGSTAAAYANAYLGERSAWGSDALTVSPYLGDDSLQPFVEVAQQRGGGVFVLVKTSNPGGKLFQDLVADSRPLYEHVARHVERLAKETTAKDGYGVVGAVVGATYPEQLSELRSQMPHSWFLVPGFGAQGGSAAGVAGAFDERGLGALINNSRGIIFAHSLPAYRHFGDQRWQQAVEAATRDMIAELGAATPAGKLASD